MRNDISNIILYDVIIEPGQFFGYLYPFGIDLFTHTAAIWN